MMRMPLRTCSVQGDRAMDHSVDHVAYNLQFFVGLEE